MPLTTTLLIGSDNILQGGMFEPHTNTITLDIKWCADVDEAQTVGNSHEVQAWLADTTKTSGVIGVPGFPAQFYNGTAWANFVPNTEFGMWRVRSVDVKPNGADNQRWTATITQTNMGKLYNTASTPSLYGVPSVTVNTVSRPKTVNAWRANPTPWEESTDAIYDDGSADNNGLLMTVCPYDWQFCDSDKDIGGTEIDINGGNATQYNVGQDQITIEFLTRSPWTDANDVVQQDPKWLNLYWLTNLINSRNAETWFGYDPGFLLVSDVAVQPMHHEFKRVTMTLLYDKWKHGNQRPWVTSTGIVAATNTCSGAPNPTGNELVNLTASYVGWLQPFQLLGSFGTAPGANLFPNGVWDDIWDKIGGFPSSSYSPNLVPDGCE